MSSQLFSEWSAIADAIADVRSDQTPTNWMVCGYVDGAVKVLELKAKGEGGVDEMKEQFKATNAYYGLARIEEMIDSSLTIKFAFVKFVGDDLKPLLRAGITPQVGDITTKFKPYHVDMYITSQDEISQHVIEELVGKASMSRSNVMEKHEGEKIQRDNEERQRRLDSHVKLQQQSSSSSTVGTSSPTTSTATSSPVRSASTTTRPVSSSPRPSTPLSSGGGVSGGVEFDNIDSIQEAIRSVRNDGDATNWMSITYAPNSKTKLTLLGKGEGGVDEMKDSWGPTGVYFGLVRVTEIIDDSETVKFVFVHMLGDNVHPMLKGRVSTHKGQVEALLQPYHTTFFTTNKDEISQEELSILVAKASQSYKWEIKK
ncbi:actin binding protein [Naegleria gruberi]|uniref:Actin binding protein n=1 Tax=Naegleria gruberi TaxID=5762 RepID=D2VU88_NAEGR|nr:actin binding protein [Naegleria gruberi]EFC39585.1 actin binding protein [Naegleria gruberi]|eukprot:XP_002672329.1 actin binding protein [Naegleria gruberi strain NEG-M]